MGPVFAALLLLATVSAGYQLSQVKFYQFNDEGRKEININQLKPSTLKLDPFVRQIKILCHGWTSNIETDWYNTTASAYLRGGQPNVFAIDWGYYAQQQYPDAVRDAYKVGEYVGEIVYAIHEQTGISLDEFHLIGHSLGAHLVGMVGQYIAGKSETKIGRLTGLDPAGPSYDSTAGVQRLSFDDARFVDVIHTNTIFLGYKKSMGHVDFWPNGGRDQAGCNGDISCSHGRAPQFFAESINSTSFPSWYCDSIELFNEGRCFGNIMIYMGDKAPRNMRGSFFLTTNPQSPFGKPLTSYGLGN